MKLIRNPFLETVFVKEQTVKINNRLDPVCTLYYNGRRVGKIKNNTALADVCAQVVQLQDSGYSIKYNGKFYQIELDGRIENTPEGFYDSEDKSMRIIMGF